MSIASWKHFSNIQDEVSQFRSPTSVSEPHNLTMSDKISLFGHPKERTEKDSNTWERKLALKFPRSAFAVAFRIQYSAWVAFGKEAREAAFKKST